MRKRTSRKSTQISAETKRIERPRQVHGKIVRHENYPLGIVEHLRALGLDVLTTREAGNAGRGLPDEHVLAFATSRGRAVITHNRRHFFRLHALSAGQHAGIVAFTFDPDEARQADRVHQAILKVGGELAGLVLRIYRPVQ